MGVRKIRTAADAVALLEKAVEIKGADFVYTRRRFGSPCLYVVDDVPSCIVGYALKLTGVATKRIAALDKTSNANSPVAARRLHAYLPDVVSHEAAIILDRAQVAQDAGETWGSALGAAEEKAREIGDFVYAKCSNHPGRGRAPRDCADCLANGAKTTKAKPIQTPTKATNHREVPSALEATAERQQQAQAQRDRNPLTVREYVAETAQSELEAATDDRVREAIAAFNRSAPGEEKQRAGNELRDAREAYKNVRIFSVSA
jgi:hypothetical protein